MDFRPVDRDFEGSHAVIYKNTLIFISIHCYCCSVVAQESYRVVRGNFFRVARAVQCSNSYIAHKLALHSPHVYMISHPKRGFVQTPRNPPCPRAWISYEPPIHQIWFSANIFGYTACHSTCTQCVYTYNVGTITMLLIGTRVQCKGYCVLSYRTIGDGTVHWTCLSPNVVLSICYLCTYMYNDVHMIEYTLCIVTLSILWCCSPYLGF